MTAREKNSLFLRTLAGNPSDVPPVWLMRQAGRYLPEYRATREKAGGFLDLCYNSELATEVTLQPIRRYGFDAAILFADILLLPHALGQNLWFEPGEGPRLDPVVTPESLASFRNRNIHSTLAPVYETVTRVRAGLPDATALIGFAGAPWTVATYMLAGGPLKDPSSLRRFWYDDRDFLLSLISLLTEATIDYLVRQIDAGADAVQLFDTWAGGLPPEILDAVSVQPLLHIAREVKARRGTPVILFPKGVGPLLGNYAQDPNVAAVGIDYAADWAWVRREIAPLATVQGGLDPMHLIAGGPEMESAARRLVDTFRGAPYIFNLGHGITPEASPAHVARLVEIVREGRGGA